MYDNTKEIIKKFNLRLTKSLGQNFLTEPRIISNIVDAANIEKNDIIVEVGPGIGSMTKELSNRALRVVAIEIDKYLIPALKFNLKACENIVIVNEDVLKLDLNKLIDQELINCIDDADKKGVKIDKNDIRVKVVANLPYYITTPIIMKFFEEEVRVDRMVFMIQKEVAYRMTAKPGGKEYGALSVAVQYYSKPSIEFNVPPEYFIPRPEVDSAVISLDVFEEPPVQLQSKTLFFKTVKASFGQRRKTLINALSNSGMFNKNKEELKDILQSLGIDEKQRGETLSIEQFASLSNLLE